MATSRFLALSSSEQFPTEFSQSVDSIAKTIKRHYKIPAIAVALVDRRFDPPRVLQRAYGSSSITGKEASAETLFPIGSINKSLTATVFAHLIESNPEQLWSFSTKLRDLLASHKFSNCELIDSTATIADLLSHRLGLSTWGGCVVLPPDIDRQRLLNSIYVLPAKTDTEFRSSFLYNNLLYMFAGALLEKISGGKRYEELIEEVFREVFGGIERPRFIDRLGAEDNVAVAGYATLDDDDDDGWRMVEFSVKEYGEASCQMPLNPAGGLLMSAEDMGEEVMMILALEYVALARYIDFWLTAPTHLGKAALHQLAEPQAALTEERRQRSSVSQSVHGYLDEEYYYTALALTVGRHRGCRKLAHGGDVATFISRLVVLPDERFGLFISQSGPGMEQGHRATMDMEHALLDLFFNNGVLKTWTLEQLERPLKVVTSRPLLNEGLQQKNISIPNAESYVGEYENELLGVIRVQLAGSQLEMFIGEGKIGTLTPSSKAMMRGLFDMHLSNEAWPEKLNAFAVAPTPPVVFELRVGEERVGALRAGWVEPGAGPEEQPVFVRK